MVDTTIMISFTAFVFAISSISIVFALTLTNPSLIQQGSTTANVTNSDYIYECDGTRYGYDLDSTSCTEALDQINFYSTTQQTYGLRYTGQFDVKLPQRYLSCSSSQI